MGGAFVGAAFAGILVVLVGMSNQPVLEFQLFVEFNPILLLLFQ